MTLAERYGLGDDMNIGGPSDTDQTIEQEYQAYVTAVRSSFTDILKFWEVRFFISQYISALRTLQLNMTTFPTLFLMAMDYVPIQASSVLCERIFSSSAETTTKRRNRISPVLMEALQMLKFHLKQDRLNFTDS